MLVKVGVCLTGLRGNFNILVYGLALCYTSKLFGLILIVLGLESGTFKQTNVISTKKMR